MNAWDRVKEYFHKRDKELHDNAIILTQPVSIREVNIGEPVFEFVKCVQENPKRFQLQKINRIPGTHMCKNEYKFTDKVTGESWDVATDYRWVSLMYGSKIEWLTDDECRYIARSVAEVYNRRVARLMQLRNIRSKRATQCERQRLMKVYCK